MRKNALILTLLLLANVAAPKAQGVATDDSTRQYTSWSLFAGPNISGFRANLENTDGAPDRILPGIGADLGAAISYHITPKWQLRLSALACLERSRLVSESQAIVLGTLGAMITPQAGYSFCLNAVHLLLLGGPYTHFIWASHTSDNSTPNPYSRIVARNPRTDNPLFALGDLDAGAALTLALIPCGRWQADIDLKWSFTDLLNADSHQLFAKPFKIAFHLAYTFK